MLNSRKLFVLPVLIFVFSSNVMARSNKSNPEKVVTATKKEIVVIPDVRLKGTAIVESFDFRNVDVMTLVKQISRLTGKKFILNEKVAKKKGITIISPTAISVQDAYNVFLTALDDNDLAVVKSGQFLKIIPKKDVAGGVSLYKGDYYPRNDEYITRIIKLKHISATDLATDLSDRRRGFIGAKKIKMKALEDTNTLLVTGTGSQIADLEGLIKLLDVKGYDYQLAVIPIKQADAENIKKIIENLLVFEGARVAKRRIRRKGVRGAERYSKIFADDRTNSIIVFANAPGIKKIKRLITKLDFEIEGGTNFHIYSLKNAKAEDISKTLSTLIGRRGKKGAVTFQDVKITADKGVNALVVSAKPKQFDALKNIIDRLDKRKGQVLFETITMEISLNDDSSFGIASNYALSSEIPRAVGFDPGVSSSNNMMNFLTNPSALSGMILGFGSKRTVSVTLGGEQLNIPTLSGFITALEKNSEANVLQRPSIITSDNEEAEIKVMDKIPVVKGTFVGQTGSQQNIDTVEVGLLLKITPRINEASNFIKLDITQETSNLTDKAPRDLVGTTVSTNTRNIKTSVLVRDRDTVVIGGLYRDDMNVTYNKVPILGDIPLIGWLFKGKTTRATKTNLLVFITPHIIRDYASHNALTLDAIKGRKGFIKAHYGGKDRFEGVINAIERKNKMKISEKKDYMPESGIKPIEFN